MKAIALSIVVPAISSAAFYAIGWNVASFVTGLVSAFFMLLTLICWVIAESTMVCLPPEDDNKLP